MSPAARKPATKTKAKEFKEHVVKGKDANGHDRSATVNVVSGQIKVQWLIGDPVYFTPEYLERVVFITTGLNTQHPDVWLRTEDSRGHEFWVRIEKTKLYADQRLPMDDSQVPNVSWAQMRTTLAHAVKFLSTTTEES